MHNPQKKYNQKNYVLTMHSNEITVNTSPYTTNSTNQKKLIDCLENLFSFIKNNNYNSLRLKDILDDKCFSKIVVNDILEKNIIKKCDQLPYTG